MKKMLLFITLSVLSLATFILFTLFVRANLTDSLDFDLMVKIQDATPRRLDQFFLLFTTLAKFQVMSVLLIVILLIWRKWLGLFVLPILFVIAHVIEVIGKELLFHSPPPFMFYRHPTEFIFPELHTFDHSSYPSGHSLRIVFVGMTLLFLLWQLKKLPVWLRAALIVICAGLIFLTLYSRVSLGEHWPSDVVGGALLGLGMVSVGLIFLEENSDKKIK